MNHPPSSNVFAQFSKCSWAFHGSMISEEPGDFKSRMGKIFPLLKY